MRQKILDLLPEIGLIQDAELREKVIATFERAAEMGGWNEEDFEKIPFTLLIPDTDINLFQHTRAVTLCALGVFEAFEKVYGASNPLRKDLLIAGALLHDVGKLLEYKKEAGKIVKAERGALLRHPFSGMALAWQMGLPDEVCHIIATHAKEGEVSKRIPEAVVVHHCDFTNFEPFKG